MITTAGQILVNKVLPKELRDHTRVLDKGGIKKLLRDVAERYPERYVEISKALSDVGREVAYYTGGDSVGLDDLQPSDTVKQLKQRLRDEIRKIEDDNPDEQTREAKVLTRMLSGREELVKSVLEDAKLRNNPLVRQLAGAGRGNKNTLNSMLGGDVAYVDHRNNPIALPVLNSYSDGLTPAEYFAGSFGARKGLIDLKAGTADAGFLAKQLLQVSHRLLTTAIDDDRPYDATQPRGLPTSIDDPDNEGSRLAVDTGIYKRNTPLTPAIIGELKNQGHKRLLVRSPTVGGPGDGGVYVNDVGIREKGQVPIGDFVGIAASNALAEPVTQMTISSKHCLTAGTMVRMADWSVKAIEDIVAGDVVLGSDREGRLSATTVVQTFDNGLRDCVKTVFRTGCSNDFIELLSTADHKLLATARYWALPHNRVVRDIIRVGERCVGYGVMMPREVAQPAGGHHEPMALLLGLLLGDGCYTVSVNGIHLSCFDPSLIKEIEPYLQSLGLKASKLTGHIGYYRISMIEDFSNNDPETGRFVAEARNPIKKYLVDRGMHGKYAYEKQIPEEVWSWDIESVAALLAGLFASDGSIYCATSRKSQGAYAVGFGSTSLALANTIRELLRVRFGIWPGPLHENKKSRKRTLHYFTINRPHDVLRFCQLIPVVGVKRQVAEAYMRDPFTSVKDHRYCYRKSQTAIGQLPTYDIQVDNEDHLFVLANGLIVSNSGGALGAQAGAIAGFPAIAALVNPAEGFSGFAAHSDKDGFVRSVDKAPQGGHFIDVEGQKHYVPPGQAPLVEVGAVVEAGDALSNGLLDPVKITKHKGTGEGRRYFTDTFQKILKGSGSNAHRRNVELLARGLINHVRLDDELDEYGPDDVIPYQMLERRWQPREGARETDPQQALGMYLEKPILHYTIGTPIRPSVVKMLGDYGVKSITAHREAPPFRPEVLRGMAQASNDPDWMTRMLGSYQQKSLLTGLHRGAKSDMGGSSFVPALAAGVKLDDVPATTGWKPAPAPLKRPTESLNADSLFDHTAKLHAAT